MKATLTIEIWDSTSEEKLNSYGVSRHDMARMYQKAFSDIIKVTLSPGTDASIACVVTDNTKEGDSNG